MLDHPARTSGLAYEREARREDLRVPNKEALRASGQVQSLSRALKLLNALSFHSLGLSLSEVAHEVGLPNSTAHRLLTTLQNERYVRFDSERSVWLIGVQAFRVGTAFVRSRDVVTIARPYMRRLMEQSGETANLAILDGTEAVFIDQVQCRETMRTIVRLGSRVPLHASGVGKAIFASLPDEQIEAIMKVKGLPRITDNTITSSETMWASLRVIRQRGWSFDDEEHAIGTRCVASPIYDEHAEVLGAISLAGPSSRLPDPRIKQLGPLVAHTAEEITKKLGGRWLHPR